MTNGSLTRRTPANVSSKQPAPDANLELAKNGGREAPAPRRREEQHKGHQGGRGYSFIHHAVDDHPRLTYSEILLDEKKEAAAGFWLRARASFADHGITVLRVITDKGACYRSGAFQAALARNLAQIHPPLPPQTNGKVERFNRTLEAERPCGTAYTSDESRAATN